MLSYSKPSKQHRVTQLYGIKFFVPLFELKTHSLPKFDCVDTNK